MRTKYIPGIEVPDYDKLVDEVLANSQSDGGGNQMRIAIRNRSSQVYRLVDTVGMGEYIHTVFALLELGFSDLLKDKPTSADGYDSLLEPATHQANSESKEWSDTELQAAVDAYVWMLSQEAQAKPYSKADINRMLRDGPLAGRSKASIEYRMQNISAALEELCLRRLDGYMPAKNVGSGVRDRILAALERAGAVQLQDFAATTDDDELGRRVARLRRSLQTGTPKGIAAPERVTQSSLVFSRDPLVRAWVLEQADGKCEVCGAHAPFVQDDGTPYLEVHHVLPLANGGSDTTRNAIACCPNCHRYLHHGRDRETRTDELRRHITRLSEVSAISPVALDQ